MNKDFNLKLENAFRGDEFQLIMGLCHYAEMLKSAEGLTQNRVVDIGCGRGEWLKILNDIEKDGIGVDTDQTMVDLCKANGLNAVCADALEYLRQCPDGSVAAVTAFHVAEHLSSDKFIEILREVLRVLEDGGLFIAETPNCENLLVSSSQFHLDPSHDKPIPPDLMGLYVQYAGFEDHVIRRVPYGLGADNDQDLYQYMIWAAYEYQNYAVIAVKKAEHSPIDLEKYQTKRVVYFDAVSVSVKALADEVGRLSTVAKDLAANDHYIFQTAADNSSAVSGRVAELEQQVKALQDVVAWLNQPWHRKNKTIIGLLRFQARLKIEMKQRAALSVQKMFVKLSTKPFLYKKIFGMIPDERKRLYVEKTDINNPVNTDAMTEEENKIFAEMKELKGRKE
jgi:SAM-dependent methyltransferase